VGSNFIPLSPSSKPSFPLLRREPTKIGLQTRLAPSECRARLASAVDTQIITSGPLPDFYDHPHPHINRFQYWELRIIWLMLRGECFRIPIFNEGGSTSSLSHPMGEGRGGQRAIPPSALRPPHSSRS
jgi:hypothetical protein